MLLWIFTAGAGVFLLATRPTAPVRPAPAERGIPQAAVDAMAAGARVPPITHTRVAVQPGQHPLLEFMHPALGIIGLGSWIAFVATKYHTFAWVSFGVLLVTIAAGLTWFTVNRRQAAARAAATSERLETSAAPGAAGVLVTSVTAGGVETSEVSGAGVRSGADVGAETNVEAEVGGGSKAGVGSEADALAAVAASGATGRRYPPRRVLIHGSGAGLTLILAVITLLVSVHG